MTVLFHRVVARRVNVVNQSVVFFVVHHVVARSLSRGSLCCGARCGLYPVGGHCVVITLLWVNVQPLLKRSGAIR